MTLIQTIPILFFLATAVAPGLARAEWEQPKAGFVYVQAASAAVRDVAKPEGKVVSNIPHGGRILYRRVLMGDDGNPKWYHAERPGLPAGWVAATDVVASNPSPLPPGKPLKLVETGLGNDHPTSTMTAAAHGMDERAVKYGKAQNLEKTVNEFLTLEKEVETLYQDPHSSTGTYPENSDNPLRQQKAQTFREGRK